jgi:outer membrane protein OmpA-like peptidoglycan-associated protein
MNRFAQHWFSLLSLIVAVCALPAFCQQSSVTGNEDTGYHMKVVSRSTQAVDYHHKSSTKVNLQGTDLAPQVSGEAKVDAKAASVSIDANLQHLSPPNGFGMAYLTYVLWAISPEGQARNLGELLVKDGKSSLHATTDLQAFALIVTAEPDFAVAEPSELVVAQNVIRSDTKGGTEPVNVQYQLISRGTYDSQVQPIQANVYDISKKTPLNLLEARNAVRIAKDADAGQYAAAELQKAQDLLNQAEDYYRRKQGNGPIGTVAREAAQTAEEARVMAVKNEQQAQVEEQQREAEERTAEAKAEAEKQQAAAAQAQAQAQAQQAAAAQAQQQAEQAQQAKQQAEQARQQAEQQQQQAELARQQAEQARQQAENDKAQMRARMLQQLNQVLQTKDTARGLIVSMPDVLFDTAKADLRPTARERLAKVAGILLSYPDIHVEIDGFTDSTGSQAFNDRLSQERADAVRNYLASQGVNLGSMTTQGLGPSQPIASNATPSGRAQNRRVELVVSGSSIGQVGQNAQPNQPVVPASVPHQTVPATPAQSTSGQRTEPGGNF